MMLLKMLRWLGFQGVVAVSLMVSLWTIVAQSQTVYYMDRDADCGAYRSIGRDEVVIIESTSNVPPASPITKCSIFLESGHDDDRYRFEISVERLQINDNTIFLTLYDSERESGATLRRFGTSSSSTDVFHGSSSFLTIKLTRGTNLAHPDYDFMLRIKLVGDPDSGGVASNSQKLSTGALIGIIAGGIILVIIPIVLCCMYGRGQLPGQRSRPRNSELGGSSTRSKDSLNSISTKASGDAGLDNPVVYHTDFKDRDGPPGYSTQPRVYMPRRQNASYSSSVSELNGSDKGSRQTGRAATRQNGSTVLSRKPSGEFIPLELNLIHGTPPRPVLNQLVASRPALGYDPRSRPDNSQEYPYNDNEAFYLGASNHSDHGRDVHQRGPAPSSTIVHQGPAKSSAIRDKIRLNSEV